MRVCLVNIQYHEGNNVFPPLGVLYVGAALREAGHDVAIFDGDPTVRTSLVDEVAATDPQVVGISFLTMTFDRARDFIVAVRQRLPDAIVVAGGAHVTADPEGSLQDLDIDYLVVGEGEVTTVELLSALSSHAAAARVPGVRVPGAPAAPPRDNVEDLDSLPFPARDLLGHEPYLEPPGLIRGYASSRVASMLASRGCPYACSFCASKQQLGRKVRIRSVEDVVAELDDLVEVDGIRGMYFVDDVFTFDREWTLAFCEALRDRPYSLEWGCQARVTEVDGELLRAMRQAGCVQVDFGVESGSTRMLRQMKKGTTPERVVEAFNLARAAGLRTGASFVLGSPGEALEDLRQTAEIAQIIDSDWTVFFFSTPYPGTPLYQQTREFHAAYPDYGEHWNNRVTAVPFAQGSVDPGTLAQMRARLQNRHFRRNYLHRRNARFILELSTTLRRAEVRRVAWRVLTRRGRLDDLVEGAFSAWRQQVLVAS